ncbi:hypothetical protein FS837_000101 [Tulasnella sp. UAMH 9824]|nr:hypothetical protein FS837_000101 [Tulasnella sp. UAMH 9824]
MVSDYINRLPTETWILIINCLYDMEQEPNRPASALRSVRRTRRLFGELDFPRFWGIIIDFDGIWRQVSSALEEGERKTSAVYQLVVKLCGRRASTFVGMEDDDPQAKLTVVKLTNLEELEIYGGKTWSAFLDQMFNFPSLKVWLRELDMVTCKPECIANTSPPPVTLDRLEKFYGYAVVAAHVCRRAPVSYLYLCVPREETQLEGVLSDVRNALTAGSVSTSKINIP